MTAVRSQPHPCFTQISGAVSTEVLATDIQAAIDNPAVRAIVLDVDSPGGAAAGINELANVIFESRGKKPIVARVGGTGASAAYWLGAAADRLYVDATGLVGSIGVVATFLDSSKRDEASGVRQVEIVSSQSPDKRLDVVTEDGRAKVQATVDSLAQVFIDRVATFRGVTSRHVIENFGRGGLVVGAAAVAAGMADALGSLESVIASSASMSPSA
jgi:ClpP class serine protease